MLCANCSLSSLPPFSTKATMHQRGESGRQSPKFVPPCVIIHKHLPSLQPPPNKVVLRTTKVREMCSKKMKWHPLCLLYKIRFGYCPWRERELLFGKEAKSTLREKEREGGGPCADRERERARAERVRTENSSSRRRRRPRCAASRARAGGGRPGFVEA